MTGYDAMESALEFLAPFGPDLRNGMTSHAPMAAEALCAVGRSEAVLPWLERYRKELAPRPAPGARIVPAEWHGALGHLDRTAGWTAFFDAVLAETPWRTALSLWTARLAPGMCASATHGVLRTAHAVRCLGTGESPARLRELAEGLGYWAANYQTLPTATGGTSAGLRPRDAMARVRRQPAEQRSFSGTIVSALVGLDDFPAFAPVIDLIDTTPPADHVLSDLTETFARTYLANARDLLGAVIFVHGVTSVAGLRSLLPYLDPATTRATIRFAWQAGAGLYVAFGTRPPGTDPIDPPREDPATLVDMAIANGDEHAIKFTEACLREHALRPSSAYVAAARHAIDTLVAG